MLAERGRHRRVAVLVQRELAGLLQRRVGLVAAPPGLLTLSHVRVNADLSVADVYVTLLLGDPEQDRDDAPVSSGTGQPPEPITRTLQMLNEAAPVLRKALAERLALRGVPMLRFHHFDGPRRAVRLDNLLDLLGSDQPADKSS